MSMDFRFPNITAKDEAGQLLQMKSFLHQLVQELNYAMKTVEGGSASVTASTGTHIPAAGGEETKSQATFNSIKGLIIKSADIVNAYYESINKRLEGLYVAQSDFGTYTEEASQLIKKNSTSIELFLENMQEIITNLETMEHSLIEVSANIRPGLLYYDDSGIPVYGLEIGQRTKLDGEEVFDKFARFTSDRLSFYDQNDNEVAYISDRKLYITHVEVKGTFRMGGFIDTTLSDGSIVTKWVGIGG